MRLALISLQGLLFDSAGGGLIHRVCPVSQANIHPGFFKVTLL